MFGQSNQVNTQPMQAPVVDQPSNMPIQDQNMNMDQASMPSAPMVSNDTNSTMPSMDSNPTSAPVLDTQSAPSMSDSTGITFSSTDTPQINNPARNFLNKDDAATTNVANTPTKTETDTKTETGPVDPSLLAIKQEALEKLTPLVDQLDQSPEEKFHTTMMMIQASDNQSMIQTAYDAAQQISDEKERAQALLDVVNEINYFTQKSGN